MENRDDPVDVTVDFAVLVGKLFERLNVHEQRIAVLEASVSNLMKLAGAQQAAMQAMAAAIAAQEQRRLQAVVNLAPMLSSLKH